jgi:hypothetical protein
MLMIALVHYITCLFDLKNAKCGSKGVFFCLMKAWFQVSELWFSPLEWQKMNFEAQIVQACLLFYVGSFENKH